MAPSCGVEWEVCLRYRAGSSKLEGQIVHKKRVEIAAGTGPSFPRSLVQYGVYDLTSSECPYATAGCFDRCHFITPLAHLIPFALHLLHNRVNTLQFNYEYYLFFTMPPAPYFRLCEAQGACTLCSLTQSRPLELWLALVNVSLFCYPHFTDEKSAPRSYQDTRPVVQPRSEPR